MSHERPTSGDEQAAGADPATQEADAEGHSMLTYELGLDVARERQRQAERASRDAYRMAAREHRKEHRSILDRLRGR